MRLRGPQLSSPWWYWQEVSVFMACVGFIYLFHEEGLFATLAAHDGTIASHYFFTDGLLFWGIARALLFLGEIRQAFDDVLANQREIHRRSQGDYGFEDYD